MAYLAFLTTAYPTKKNLLKWANIGNIKKNIAEDIINQILETTQKWQDFSLRAGVSKSHSKIIEQAFVKIFKNFNA